MKKLSILLFILSLTFIKLNATPKTNFTSNEVLNELAGQYKFTPNDVVEKVTIVLEKELLRATTADGTFELKSIADKADSFKIEELDAIVIFIRDKAKIVVGLKVEVQGQTLEANKIQEEITK